MFSFNSACIEIEPCNPCPCLNGGTCFVTFDNSPSCHCILGYTGQYCETVVIKTPALPTVKVNSQTEALYINASTNQDIIVNVVCDSSIDVSPGNQLLITPMLKSVSFKLTPHAQGVFIIRYVIQTKENYEQPENSILLAISNVDNSSSMYFSSNNLNNGIVGAGCCQKITTFKQNYCISTLQNVFLSSSCMWYDNTVFKTKGITFIHTEDLMLPLSIAGVNASLSSQNLDMSINNDNLNCGQCPHVSNQTDQCFNWDLNVFDTHDMVISHSLFATFLNKTYHVLPVGLNIELLSTSIKGIPFQYYDFLAVLKTANEVQDIQGCELLSLEPSGLYYIVRVNTNLKIRVKGQNLLYQYHLQSRPICFALDICQGKFSTLHISLTEKAGSVLTDFYPISQFKTAGWNVNFTTCKLSSLGLDLLSNEFWNGTQNVHLDVQLYDTAISLTASGKLLNHNLTVDVSFTGEMFLKINTVNQVRIIVIFSEVIITVFLKSTVKLHGNCSIDILSLSWMLHLESANESGLLIVNGKCSFILVWFNNLNLILIDNNSQFIEGMIMMMAYSPLYNTNGFNDIFFTDDDSNCPVSIFISFNMNDFIPQWVSMNSNCLGIRLSRLLIPGLTSTLVIPGKLPFWAENPNTQLRIMSHNSGNVKNLGKFIKLPSTDSQMVIDVAIDGQVTGKYSDVNISVFDVTIVADIFFKDLLSFREHATFFSHYSGVFNGSAELTTPWESQVLNIDILFDQGEDTFQQETENNLYELIYYATNFTIQRMLTASNNVENAKEKLSYLEAEVEALEYEYLSILQAQEEAKADILYWNNVINQTQDELDQLINEYNINEAMKADINQLCDIFECEKVCENGSKAVTCYKPTYISVDGTCRRYQPVSIMTQRSRAKFVTYCEYVKSCKKKLGIKWFFAGEHTLPLPIPKPIPIFIPLPWLVDQCYEVCHVTGRYEEMFVDTVDTMIQKTAFICPVQQYNGSKPYICWKFYDCATKLDKEPCATANAQCREMKQQALINATGASAEALLKINATYQSLAVAIANEHDAKTTLEIKETEGGISEQQLNLTRDIYNIAIFAYNASLQNYDRILADSQEDIVIVNWLKNHTAAENLVQLLSIQCRVSMTTSTPVIFPLQIKYAIPYSNTSYETSVLVDFNAPFNLVKDKISEKVLEHALSVAVGDINVEKGSVQRNESSNLKNVANYFQSNCLTLQKLQNYLNYVNKSLEDALNNTVESRTIIEFAINNAEERVNETLSLSSNLTNKFYNNLAKKQTKYDNTTKFILKRLSKRVLESSLQYWINELEDYHSNSKRIAGYRCFGFSDCLYHLTDIFVILLHDVPGDKAQFILKVIPDVTLKLSSLTSNSSLTIYDAIDTMTLVREVIASISDIEYWCASPPNITIHPPSELFVRAGSNVTLTCSATSSLSFTYRWLKNDFIIPNAETSELTINNFQISDEAVYVCEAVNAIGTTRSNRAIVKYYQIPQLTLQPKDVSTYVGDESGVELRCDATATPDPSWMWYFKRHSNVSWDDVSGEKSSVLYFEKPTLSDAGWYRCEAKNEHGKTESKPVKLALLAVSVARNAYPIQFSIEQCCSEDSPGSISSGIESGSGSSSNELLFDIQRALNLNTAMVEDFNVQHDPTLPTHNIIRFNLYSTNVTRSDIEHQSIEEIATMFSLAIYDLEIARQKAKDIFSGSVNMTLQSNGIFYQVVPDTLTIDELRHVCPEGQQLNSNYFLCGKYVINYSHEYTYLLFYSCLFSWRFLVWLC